MQHRLVLALMLASATGPLLAQGCTAAFFRQALVLDPGHNLLGAVTSNAAAAVTGN